MLLFPNLLYKLMIIVSIFHGAIAHYFAVLMLLKSTFVASVELPVAANGSSTDTMVPSIT